MRNRLLAVRLALGAVGLFALDAAGQPRGTNAADTLFREGRDAMKRNDYTVACTKFAESQRLDPADGTLVNLALCEEKSGRFELALNHVKSALRQLPSGDPMHDIALALAGRLQPKLTVQVADDVGTLPGIQVRIDDAEPLKSTHWGTPLAVDPGQHTIQVTATGRSKWSKSVTISAGAAAQTVVVGHLEPEPEMVAAKKRPPPAEPATGDSTGSTQTTMSFVLMGAGGVAAVSGFAFLLLGSRADHDAVSVYGCTVSKCPTQDGLDATARAKQDRTIGTVLLVTGGAALSVGAVLLLTAPNPSSATARMWIGPSVGRERGGVTWGGAW